MGGFTKIKKRWLTTLNEGDGGRKGMIDERKKSRWECQKRIDRRIEWRKKEGSKIGKKSKIYFLMVFGRFVGLLGFMVYQPLKVI